MESSDLKKMWSANGINALALTCGHAGQVVQDELKARLIFTLPDAAADLVRDNQPPFGENAANAFPLAVEDIEEAAKCLAFSRYTAAVFHLMRAMEAAVQRISKEIGVADTEREWGKLLSDMAKKIEPMPKGDRRNRWSESHAHLYHVKQAWRNDTMHPKKTYTEEEADNVYRAVKSFMSHLATLVESEV